MLERALRWVDTGDGQVAYAVFGSGPVDALVIDDWMWHLEALWDDPDTAAFYDRLGSFARVVMWNRRGVGLSDPLPGDRLSTLDSGLEDVIAVMDAAGMYSAAVMGFGGGVALAASLAAIHPQRVRSLVLSCDLTALAYGDDRVNADERFERYVPEFTASWGSGVLTARAGSPTMANDPRYVAWLARMERLTASPRTATALWRATYETDLSAVLPLIAAPTLVIHMTRNRLRDSHLADSIPAARYVEVVGDTFWCSTDNGRFADEVEEFLTGHRSAVTTDRVLATVLFVDIVDSTDMAATLGDRRWSGVLDAFDQAVERQLDRFAGRRVKAMGDGTLATFDGPARAIRCAQAIRDASRGVGLEVRTGIHAGEIERRGEDIGGIAVHTAARVQAAAEPGEILVSRTVTDLVAGSGIGFTQRGDYELKGLPGKWQLLAVND